MRRRFVMAVAAALVLAAGYSGQISGQTNSQTGGQISGQDPPEYGPAKGTLVIVGRGS